MDLKIFKTHRPKDTSDPGFTIPGARLRWISGRVRETGDSTALWTIFRKSKLDKKLVDHIENCYPGAFADGDTIRRGSGELVLAYTTEDMALGHRKYLDGKSKDQSASARLLPKQEYIGKKDYAKITNSEESASSIPSQFLKNKESE